MSVGSNDKTLALDRESLTILGDFYRECVGQSHSKELKRIVRSMTNTDLGALAVFIQAVNELATELIYSTAKDTEQQTLPI